MKQLTHSHFFTCHNFYISFCSIALLKYTSLGRDIVIPSNIYAFTFFATLFSYTVLRQVHSINDLLNPKKKLISTIVAISVLIIGVLFFFLSKKTMLLYAVIGFMLVLYKTPFYKGKNLRRIPYLKIIIIAFVWVLIGVVYPFLWAINSITYTDILFIIAQLFFFIAIIIPFDIADAAKDDFKTLPILLGTSRSFVLSIVCVTVYVILNSLVCHNTYELIAHIFLGIVIVLTIIGWKKTPSRSYLYYAIDGLIILQLIAVVVVKYLTTM